MRKYILLSLTCFLLLSFKKSGKKFIPPGTVQINDSLYADEKEITIQAWKEYEMWMQQHYGKGSPQHLAALPDSIAGLKNGQKGGPNNYYRFKTYVGYKDFPVTGITYDQATDFCKWRTERVKYFLSVAKKQNNLDFYYRLPSKKEWEFLASNEVVFNSKNYVKPISIKEDYQEFLVDYKANLNFGDSLYTPILMPTGSYPKNYLGLYEMIGNVAEMTNENGICKGGSWFHSLEESRPGKDLSYSEAQQWLGFRCVCIVRKAH